MIWINDEVELAPLRVLPAPASLESCNPTPISAPRSNIALWALADTPTSVLGTPDEDVWPGVSALPDYKATFPQWNAVDLKGAVKGLDDNGLDLLRQTLIYDPARRISGE